MQHNKSSLNLKEFYFYDFWLKKNAVITKNVPLREKVKFEIKTASDYKVCLKSNETNCVKKKVNYQLNYKTSLTFLQADKIKKKSLCLQKG